MWKKTDSDSGETLDVLPAVGDKANERPRRRRSAGGDTATIGSSVVIKGEVTGGEDIQVFGRIEGRIDLADSQLVVGETGDIEATVEAREVDIEGRITGNVTARDKIILRASGRVTGDLKAPKIVIEEGAQFRGQVEMDVDSASRTQSTSSLSSENTSSLSLANGGSR